MSPPVFELTAQSLRALTEIARLLGRLDGLQAPRPQLRLRKVSRVRTIHGSAGIEGNSLTLEQVTAVLEGRPVVGPRREILEIKNALEAYDLSSELVVTSQKDLLRAHRVLMKGLLEDAGCFRGVAVGVLRGRRVTHVAPPADRVQALVAGLLRWYRASPHPVLVKAVVLHYELAFIHPFADGNGRIARLWQHVALRAESPAFEFVPVESIIRERQQRYYAVLNRSNQLGAATPFVEFSLEALRDALLGLVQEVRPDRETAESRLEAAREAFGAGWFGRREYLQLHKRLSTATASRDLRDAVGSGGLEREGDKRLARYRFR